MYDGLEIRPLRLVCRAVVRRNRCSRDVGVSIGTSARGALPERSMLSIRLRRGGGGYVRSASPGSRGEERYDSPRSLLLRFFFFGAALRTPGPAVRRPGIQSIPFFPRNLSARTSVASGARWTCKGFVFQFPCSSASTRYSGARPSSLRGRFLMYPGGRSFGILGEKSLDSMEHLIYQHSGMEPDCAGSGSLTSCCEPG